MLNLQGDVVGLIDASGVWYAQYSYNAWGEITQVLGRVGNKLISVANSAPDHIANLNPLRYRGYYYDTETGFYYLQSRYYDPITHRFINADSIASTGQGIIGTNMFAYCNNSPVMYSDHTGHILKPFTEVICDGGGGTDPWEDEHGYITDQNAPGLGEKLLTNNSFLSATVSHGGCGVVATHNANTALGNHSSFDDVLHAFQDNNAFTLHGWLGMMPGDVVNYYEEQGYTVIITDDPYEIDVLSQCADACIMWYAFESSSFPGIGAHFAIYEKDGDRYKAYNAGAYGVAYFDLPSEYAYKNNRFYGQVIFIFD